MAKKTDQLIEKDNEALKKGEDKEKDIKSESIYVKVSEEVRKIIDKYKEKGKTISSLIEDAIKLYDETPEISEDLDLWCRARDRGMMLIGKTTFNQLLAAAGAPRESLEKPQKKNNALDVILWYLGPGKKINTLTLKEVVLAIQKMWTVSNYFDRIDLDEENGDLFHLTFIHSQNYNYSSYWYGYFEVLFNNLNENKDVPFHCAFEGQVLEQTLTITIKELFEENKKEKD
ncbi:MAG: hypothetical protein ACTSQJ_05905 [Promethearchaeota archaeon]